MDWRFATLDDVDLLARMNRQLVEDERHRNRSRPDAWFEERVRGFLTGAYRAVLFDLAGDVVAYALYRQHPEHADTIHLRQLFVTRAHRRQGIGREVVRTLQEDIWPRGRRVTVAVLVGNDAARAFYEAVGFGPYAIELELPAQGKAAKG
jgi:ribosomal protein S18 acetylase RimI-like enzyme